MDKKFETVDLSKLEHVTGGSLWSKIKKAAKNWAIGEAIGAAVGIPPGTF